MCGIVAAASRRDIVPTLVEGFAVWNTAATTPAAWPFSTKAVCGAPAAWPA